ncbi:RagB/SusD family nutrient uptake outer membrane protein, partial [Bacteroides uniformis]|nr:RagB/SusD family nutrient uptake outer membrane protein [Bacteroides uniformis]
SVINYANDFLHEMENSSLFSLQIKEEGPTEIQQMYGEVKTLRAMLYLDLIRTWGDVVFVTEPSKSTDDFFSV